MSLINKGPRGALVALAVIAGSCVLAACGSSSGTSTAVASASASTSSSASGAFAARRAALVACLKKHDPGVTLPAPPPGGFRGAGAAGGSPGTSTTGRGGFFRNNPQLQAAFRACGANFGFRAGGRFGRVSHQAVDNYVACVKAHGYSEMPKPNFSGKGPIFPASIRSNPQFQAASRSCQNLLVPRGGTGGTATGGTAPSNT